MNNGLVFGFLPPSIAIGILIIAVIGGAVGFLIKPTVAGVILGTVGATGLTSIAVIIFFYFLFRGFNG